jgi:hypothetical protein
MHISSCDQFFSNNILLLYIYFSYASKTIMVQSIAFYIFEALCPAGFYSDDGMEPCMPCERHYFQDQNGSTMCKQYPSGSNTDIQGATKMSECSEGK